MSHRRAIQSSPGLRSRRRAAELRVESMEARQLLATFTVNSPANDIPLPADRFLPAQPVPVGQLLQELLDRPDNSRAFDSSIAPGDFDGDGNGDVAVTIVNTDDDEIQSFIIFGPINQANPAANRFNPIGRSAISPGSIYSTTQATGDFNGDGRLDIALAVNVTTPPAGGNTNQATTYGQSLTLLANPGVFPPPILIGTELIPVPAEFARSAANLGSLGAAQRIDSLSAGDINGDRIDDLAVLVNFNALGNDQSVGVYASSSQGGAIQLGPPQVFSASATPGANLPANGSIGGIALGRFEADGSPSRLDLAISYNNVSTNSATIVNFYRNQGNGQLAATPSPRTVSFGRITSKLNAGDFDADGISDLATIAYDGTDTASVIVAPRVGEQFSLQTPVFAASTPLDLVVGDLNDGAPDIIPVFSLSPNNSLSNLSPQSYSIFRTVTTLRDAITRSNANPGADRIRFALTPDPSDQSVPVIRLNTFLPIVDGAVEIDGYSQPGASPNTLQDGDNAVVLVRITAADSGSVFDGLTINRATSGGTSVRGLVITRFGGSGILIANAPTGPGDDGGVVIAGNLIGVDRLGTSDLGNAAAGMRIHGTTGVRVGGTSPADRNIISGNGTYGIQVDVSDGNLILGNYIGTDRTGRGALGNTLDGILINNSANTIIGGPASGAGNLISGNGTNGEGAGINLFGTASRGNQILGNFIGTDAAGAADLGNTLIGVFVGEGATGTTIRGNLISGNGTDANDGIGVYLYRSAGTTVAGNLVGTTADGSAILPGSPSAVGVLANDSNGNTIGGTAEADRNVISGHDLIGVYLAAETAGGRPVGPGSSGNAVQGNFIGTSRAGDAGIPNGFDGVNISNSPGNTVANNLISGNGSTGIQLFGAGTVDNSIAGNRIGLSASGNAALPNGVSADFPGGVGIFDNTGGARNAIAGNTGQAVVVPGQGASPTPTAVEAAAVTRVTGRGKKGARTTHAARQRKARQARARQAAKLEARARAHKVKVAAAHPKGPARIGR